MSVQVLSDKLISFASEVDQLTIDQAKQTASMDFIFPHVALMPDAHFGKGSAVGTVIPTKGAVIPAAVGVDIGCGMQALQTRYSASDIPENAVLSDLRESIESAIPLSPGNYNKSLQRFGFTHARLNELEKLARDTNVDLKHSPKWMEQLGSLGGGNHFIELCLDQDDTIWLILHSGSRGVGNKIANVHIKVAKRHCAKVGLPNQDLAYLVEGAPEFDQYIEELRWAQHFALLNRDEMLDRFKQAFAHWMGVEAQRVEIGRVRCHHNYTVPIEIDGERVWLTRKGAVDANEGVQAMIPGSMGTHSYVVTGKGNPQGLWSAPHGAGRRFSRKKAKEQFTEADLAKAMEGIEYRHGPQFIDEIPGAYKDIDLVMRDAEDLVRVDHELRQLMNVKGN